MYCSSHYYRCVLITILCLRDTLVRHASIHDDDSSHSSQATKSRVSRACSLCSKARLRCDEELPCARCKYKGIDCKYPSRSRKRVPLINGLKSVDGHESFQQHTQQQLSSTSVPPIETLVSVDNSIFEPLSLEQNTLASSSTLISARTETSSQYTSDIDSGSATLFTGTPSTRDRDYDSPSSWYFNWTDNTDFSAMDWITMDSVFLGSSAPYQPSGSSSQSHIDISGNTASPYMQSLVFQTSYNSSMHFQKDVGETSELQASPQPPMASTSFPDSRCDPEREWPANWDPKCSDSLICFPDMSQFPKDLLEAEGFAHVENMNPRVYHEICQSMNRNGTNISTQFRLLHSVIF